DAAPKLVATPDRDDGETGESGSYTLVNEKAPAPKSKKKKAAPPAAPPAAATAPVIQPQPAPRKDGSGFGGWVKFFLSLLPAIFVGYLLWPLQEPHGIVFQNPEHYYPPVNWFFHFWNLFAMDKGLVWVLWFFIMVAVAIGTLKVTGSYDDPL
ncbi:MAG TPA: hypothetical protein V6D17_14315, partial [Candidatus Obscuribacterales bacterium]